MLRFLMIFKACIFQNVLKTPDKYCTTNSTGQQIFFTKRFYMSCVCDLSKKNRPKISILIS